MTNMTTKNTTSFAQGDWLVHQYHGVGQIEDTERKRISDQEKTFFRVKMIDGLNTTIWIPVDQMDNGQIRSLADKERFQEAVEVLDKQPSEMASNSNTRKARIKRVAVNNNPKDTACLIRDLRARQRSRRGINQSERQALRDLTSRFLQEWAVCKGIKIEQARQKLSRKLRKKSAATQDRSDTTPNNRGERRDSSLLGTLVKQDDTWASWFTQQLVEGA